VQRTTRANPGLLFALAWLLPSLVGDAAQAAPGTPPRSEQHGMRATDAIGERTLPPVDVVAAIARDAVSRVRPAPLRVAVPVAFSAGPDDAGSWETLPDGGRLWRLRVRSPGAVFLSFKFSELALSEGAELHFVSVDRDYYDGPYGRRRGRAGGRFGSPMVPGEAAVIELYLPPGSAPARVRLESVSHGFRDALGMAAIPRRAGAVANGSASGTLEALGGAFECQRDINCPEGAPYQDVKRAVAEGYDGAFICSGQLLNNVRQDNRYLYLTADHCEWWIDPPTMVYYWNYESSGCGTNDAPLTFSTGSTDLFHDATADIDLLELDGTDLEGSYDVYFMGWNRGAAAPGSGASISFPSDKPKQIAIEDDPITDCSPGGCAGGFGSNFWRVEDWDVGVTEGGSSGAALLDPDQRVVGVLTGGVGTNCNNFSWDEYAKLSFAWAGLAPHLDPDATGAVSLPGKDATLPPSIPLAPGWGGGLVGGLLLLAGALGSRRVRASG
jgi:hypothetical protein